MRNTASLATSTRVNSLLALADFNGSGGGATTGFVFVRPIDGVQDDWPRLMGSIAVANAYKNTIVMLPGLHGERWQCLSSQITPNGTTIMAGAPGVTAGAGAGVIIEQGIGVIGTAACAFASNITGAGPLLTLQADVNVGDSVVHFTTDPGPVGTIIGVFAPGGLLGMITKIKSKAGAAPNVAVTFQRPVMFALSALTGFGQTYATQPQDIRIYGNGMKMIGKAGAAFVGGGFSNFVAASNVWLFDIEMDAAGFSNAQISGGCIYDVGSHNCGWVNVRTINIDGAGRDFAGCENCKDIRGLAQNTTSVGYRVEDTFNSFWEGCSALNPGIQGMEFTGATSNGSFLNTVVGGVIEGASSAGVHQDPLVACNRNTFTGTEANANAVGFLVPASAIDTTITGCRGCYNTASGVDNSGKNTAITNFVADNNTSTDAVIRADTVINGFYSRRSNANLGPALSAETGARVVLTNFDIQNSNNSSQALEVRTNATLKASGGRIELDGAGGPIAFQLDGVGSKLYVDNVECIGTLIGVNGNAGSLTRFGVGVNLTAGVFACNITTPGAFASMSFAAGFVNAGPAPIDETAGATATISFTDIRPTDTVVCTPISGTADFQGEVVITPGTGFVYTRPGAGSNRLVNWRIVG